MTPADLAPPVVPSCPMSAVPAAQARLRRAGLGADGLETGARGRGAMARRALMLPCMKRLAVSSRGVSLPVSRFSRALRLMQWTLVSRGSVDLVPALVKGEGYSPAHAGIRRVGAPSTQRPCRSDQGNFRAHPPVEPARDHPAHPPSHHH